MSRERRLAFTWAIVSVAWHAAIVMGGFLVLGLSGLALSRVHPWLFFVPFVAASLPPLVYVTYVVRAGERDVWVRHAWVLLPVLGLLAAEWWILLALMDGFDWDVESLAAID